MKTDFPRRADISLLRAIALGAIVLHHSMAVYQGWPPEHGLSWELPPAAVAVSDAARKAGLAMFTMVSGYLAASTVRSTASAWTFIAAKAMRLLLPMAVIGALYALLFPGMADPRWPAAINGTHLWYLPMLMLCMLMAAPLIALRTRPARAWAVITAAYAAVVAARGLNHTLGQTALFFPVFILGYCCAATQWCSPLRVGVCAICAAFISAAVYAAGLVPPGAAKSVCFAAAGIAITAGIIATGSRLRPSRAVDTAGRHAFSVYLLHQLIINALLVGGLCFAAERWVENVVLLFAVSIAGALLVKFLLTRLLPARVLRHTVG